MKDGEIVVIPSDKTGNLCVMTRCTYEKAGMKHVKNDLEVGMEELKMAQSEINGHVAMCIKMFKIGKGWGHTDRVRETMLGEGVAVCPVSLLFKDHKGWKNGSTSVPPTRHVAGGHRGMNLHLSEVLSDILEPLVGTIQEGVEVISTEDLLARVDSLNKDFTGWTSSSWWEGKEFLNYIACGTCVGTEDIGKPVPNEPESDDMCGCGRPDNPEPGKIRTTSTYVKLRRRLDWEQNVGWNKEDQDRVFSSKDMLQEDCQDYSVPMVMIGSDVVSLYPNLDVARAARLMYEAIQTSTLDWNNVDWLECCRYIALNWSQEQCRRSRLRRVLPWRRKSQGTRPGIKGAGPKGKERGDTEQWVFPPNIKLEDWEKREIIGTVVEIATRAMFNLHFYTFGGKLFHQKGGGGPLASEEHVL